MPYDHSFRLDTLADFDYNISDDKIQELWDTLGDVPIDDEGGIEEVFLDFPIGTDREEIWHWFEESFDITVQDLMKGIH